MTLPTVQRRPSPTTSVARCDILSLSGGVPYVNRQAEANALDSCLADMQAARTLLKRFDEDFVAPALSRFMYQQSRDPVFHPGARHALLPWLIHAATQHPEQSLESLIASLRLERLKGQSFLFSVDPQSNVRHRADARTQLSIGGPATSGPPLTLNDVAREVRKTQVAVTQFAASFAFHAAFTYMIEQWSRVDLSAFPGAETYQGSCALDDVPRLVRHPTYFLRLWTSIRFPLVQQACQNLSAKLRASDAEGTLPVRDRIAMGGPGSTYKFPSNKRVHSQTLFSDALYELLCVIDPKISHNHHMNAVRRNTPWPTQLHPQAADPPAASSPGLLELGPAAQRATLQACDYAREVLTKRYGAPRAEHATKSFYGVYRSFGSGTWDAWCARTVKAVRSDKHTDAAERADDLVLFLDLFYSEFVAIRRTLRDEQEKSDE